MKNKDRKRLTLALVFFFFAACCGIYGLKLLFEQEKEREKLFSLQRYLSVQTEKEEDTESGLVPESDAFAEEIQEIPHTTKAETEKETDPKPRESESEAEGITIPVDFAKLTQKNPDIYAWIHVPGTQINYPIVQSAEDDTFYLDHGYEKEPTAYGAIYTETINSKDFSDSMTVIYGHNMRDGSMFHSLHSFEEKDFFAKYRKFIIYTGQHRYIYQIFAAYPYSSQHLLKSRDYTNAMDFQTYLDTLYLTYAVRGNLIQTPQVTIQDKIVTLSTCIGTDHSERYLVQGVLVKTD